MAPSDLQTTPELDALVLRDLAELEEVRPGLMAGLIDKFETNRMRQINELQMAVETADRERIRAIGHSLRGSAATLGMARLAQAAHALESAPEQASADPHTCERLRGLIESGVQALKRWSASLSG